MLSLPEEEVRGHNICLLPPGVPVPLGHLHQHNVEQDGWGGPLTPRAMSLFSFLIPPLRFQMTSIGLGDGDGGQGHFWYSLIPPWSEMGHGHPEVGGGPLLAHRAVEEAEKPGNLLDPQIVLVRHLPAGVPGVAPGVDHLRPEGLVSVLHHVVLQTPELFI